MGLPKRLDHQTYSAILPSTGKEILYRPYTNGEEKVLLTALEGGDFTDIELATKQLIEACTLGSIDNLDSLTPYDMEYLFVKIRSQSVGETVDRLFTIQQCPENNDQPCANDIRMRIELDKAQIMVMDDEEGDFVVYDPLKHSAVMPIVINDKTTFYMNHPTTHELKSFEDTLEEVRKNPNDEDRIKNLLLYRCVDKIVFGDEVFVRSDFSEEDFLEFIESFSPKQKALLHGYIQHIPVLRYEDTITCKKCGMQVPLVLEGLNDFFG